MPEWRSALATPVGDRVMLAAAAASICAVPVSFLLLSSHRRSRRLAERLRLADEQRRLALDVAGFGIWTWDLWADRMTLCPVTRRLFDLAENRILSSSDFFDAAADADRDALRNAVRNAAERDGRTWEGRIAHRPQPLQRIHFRANLERDWHGEPAVLRGLCWDVTSRHAAGMCTLDMQIDLLHAARLRTLGETVSAAAHELSQPLSAAATFITSCDALLRSGRPYDDADLQARLARGLGAIDRASDIVRNLNRFLRRQGPARETFQLDAALREAVQMGAVGFERQERGRITWDMEPGLPLITGDRTQIEQVVVNLVRNAVEATAEQPVRELAITARCLGSMVRVAVSDNGPGLPHMVEHDLFRPFITTKPTGLGLGLSVCKTIIDSHGGAITVRSTPNGTTFAIDLPATLDADCALVA